MTALYLGVVVLPLFVLVLNLGLAGGRRRSQGDHRGRPTTGPAVRSPAAALREPIARAPRRRLRTLPAAFAAGFRAAWGAHAKADAGETVRQLELSPDLPRSPSVPGWVPAQGYSAMPVADETSAVRAA